MQCTIWNHFRTRQCLLQALPFHRIVLCTVLFERGNGHVTAIGAKGPEQFESGYTFYADRWIHRFITAVSLTGRAGGRWFHGNKRCLATELRLCERSSIIDTAFSNMLIKSGF